jgi:hypothetical protein
MTRSVEEMRRESERNRAQLAATVDRLREQITDTAEDLRYKVSPQGIKAEVSDFVSRKTQGWLDILKQKATENPMQTLAAGTALAVPALRLVRGLPLPLLMIGAGLAFTSKTVRDSAAEATAPVIDTTKETAGGVSDAVSATGRRAADLASEAQARAAGLAGNLKDRVVEATDNVKAGIDAASRTVQDTTERVREREAKSPSRATALRYRCDVSPVREAKRIRFGEARRSPRGDRMRPAPCQSYTAWMFISPHSSRGESQN